MLVMTGLLVGGCADVEYLPYEGVQQNWAIAPGAIVDRRFEIPVYHGSPPQPYIVIGKITVSGGRGRDAAVDATEDAIAEAKDRGADAVMLIERGTDVVGSTIAPIGSGFVASNVISGHAEVYAIKWR